MERREAGQSEVHLGGGSGLPDVACTPEHRRTELLGVAQRERPLRVRRGHDEPASISVPSARITPTTRRRSDRISFTPAPVRISAPAEAAEASAAASACVPTREHGGPGGPPSLPAESFRNSAAVPDDQGPHAVRARLGWTSAPHRFLLEHLLDEVGDGHRHHADRFTAVPCAEPSERPPHPEPGDRIGEGRRADIGGVATFTWARNDATARTFRSNST